MDVVGLGVNDKEPNEPLLSLYIHNLFIIHVFPFFLGGEGVSGFVF